MAILTVNLSQFLNQLFCSHGGFQAATPLYRAELPFNPHHGDRRGSIVEHVLVVGIIIIIIGNSIDIEVLFECLVVRRIHVTCLSEKARLASGIHVLWRLAVPLGCAITDTAAWEESLPGRDEEVLALAG